MIVIEYKNLSYILLVHSFNFLMDNAVFILSRAWFGKINRVGQVLVYQCPKQLSEIVKILLENS